MIGVSFAACAINVGARSEFNAACLALTGCQAFSNV